MRPDLDHCRPCLGHARFEQAPLEMLEARAAVRCPGQSARVLRELRIEMEQG